MTNVASVNGVSRFDIKVKAPEGYTVAVSPRVLNLNSGQTASYNVTITYVNAPPGEWRFGSLTLQGKGKARDYQVYSPIAVKGLLVKTPATVLGAGTAGSLNFPIAFGYTGNYVAELRGLAAALPQTGPVSNDPNQLYPLSPPRTLSQVLALSPVVSPHTIDVPAQPAITLARFKISDQRAGDILDLYA